MIIFSNYRKSLGEYVIIKHASKDRLELSLPGYTTFYDAIEALDLFQSSNWNDAIYNRDNYLQGVFK